jgi:hypothetical protein
MTMSGGPRYFDPDGKPLTMLEWVAMAKTRARADDSWRQRRTEVDDAEVSTVWLGVDHRRGDGPPLFWETIIFGGEHSGDQWRYSSKEAALAHHDQIVAALRDVRELPVGGER